MSKIMKLEFEKANISEMSDIDWIICEITNKRRSELPLIKEFSNEDLLILATFFTTLGDNLALLAL